MRALAYVVVTLFLLPIAYTIGYGIDSHQCEAEAHSCSGEPFIEGFFWAVGAVVVMVVVAFANEIRLTKEPRD